MGGESGQLALLSACGDWAAGAAGSTRSRSNSSQSVTVDGGFADRGVVGAVRGRFHGNSRDGGFVVRTYTEEQGVRHHGVCGVCDWGNRPF